MEVFRTDRGGGFDNAKIDELLDVFDIRRSLSRKGNPYDNAVVESTNRLLKKELIYRNHYTSLEQLRSDLNDYVWYPTTKDSTPPSDTGARRNSPNRDSSSKNLSNTPLPIHPIARHGIHGHRARADRVAGRPERRAAPLPQQSLMSVLTAQLTQYSTITRIFKRLSDIFFAHRDHHQFADHAGRRAADQARGWHSVFFRQQRIGIYGKPFTMYKFRSMNVNAEAIKKQLAEEYGMDESVRLQAQERPASHANRTFHPQDLDR